MHGDDESIYSPWAHVTRPTNEPGAAGRTPAEGHQPSPDRSSSSAVLRSGVGQGVVAGVGREPVGAAVDGAHSPPLPIRTPHPGWGVVELDVNGRVVRIIVGEPEFRSPADADLYARSRGLPDHRVAPVDLGSRVPPRL